MTSGSASEKESNVCPVNNSLRLMLQSLFSVKTNSCHLVNKLTDQMFSWDKLYFCMQWHLLLEQL
jgi:hypothetical protein